MGEEFFKFNEYEALFMSHENAADFEKKQKKLFYGTSK